MKENEKNKKIIYLVKYRRKPPNPLKETLRFWQKKIPRFFSQESKALIYAKFFLFLIFLAYIIPDCSGPSL